MTRDLDIDVPYTVQTFVAELRRLADALESGADFNITVHGEEVSVPKEFLLSIAHEREGDEAELEFQLSWVIDEEQASED